MNVQHRKQKLVCEKRGLRNDKSASPNVSFKLFAYLLRISEVPGSNLGWEIDYPHQGLT